MSDDTRPPRFQLRLPDDVRRAMEQRAAENRRSLNAEIVVACEEYVTRQLKAWVRREAEADST